MLSTEAAGGSPRLAAVQSQIRRVQEEEVRWLRHGSRRDSRCLPWMPFQPSEFIAILAECVAECDGPLFLDVGCGIGTKMALADSVFGLSVTGIEIDDVTAAVRSDDYRIVVGDALTAGDDLYREADIIWMYRPFRERYAQLRLEHLVYALAKPGAVVAGGALEGQPNGWELILDDWELRRGAWKKPLNWEAASWDIDLDEVPGD